MSQPTDLELRAARFVGTTRSFLEKLKCNERAYRQLSREDRQTVYELCNEPWPAPEPDWDESIAASDAVMSSFSDARDSVSTDWTLDAVNVSFTTAQRVLLLRNGLRLLRQQMVGLGVSLYNVAHVLEQFALGVINLPATKGADGKNA